MLVIMILAVGCTPKTEIPVDNPKENEKLEVTLYYSEDQAEFVVPEKTEIVLPTGYTAADKYKAVLEQLKKTPTTENLFATIPEVATIVDIQVKEDTVYVDFAKDIVENHSGGSAGESLTVASIVNTLTEFEEVNAVMLTIEGSPFSLGHSLCDKPMEKIEEMIRVK